MALDADVRTRLEARARAGDLPEVLILPSEVRDGVHYYSERDLEALQVARQASVDAEYLDESSDRRFLSEFSSGFLVNVALAVGSDLTASGLIAVGKYVLAQLNWLVQRGLISSVEETELNISADVIEVTDGDVRIEGLAIHGKGTAAVTGLIEALAPASLAALVRDELTLPKASGAEQDIES